YADFLANVDRPLTADETQILQMQVNQIYDTFVQRVADGRGLSNAQVDSIGQGRVWSGQQAVEHGLVDRLGSMEDAIVAAADKAGLETYRVVSYPAIKSPFEALLGGSADRISTWFSKRELGEHYRYYEQAKAALQLRGIQAQIGRAS